MRLSESQFDALKAWIQAEARAAVARDRPGHNRMAANATETQYEETNALRLLVEDSN